MTYKLIDELGYGTNPMVFSDRLETAQGTSPADPTTKQTMDIVLATHILHLSP